MKIIRCALLGALILSLLTFGSVLAHAKFVKSEPAPDSVLSAAPKQVTIWFTEELDTKLSNIKVFDAAGAQVDLANSKVNLDERKQMSVGLKPLANGVYTVKWHSVSAEDQDDLDGDFKFTVRVQTTVPAYPQPSAAASATTAPTSAPTAAPTIAPTLAATAAPATATSAPATATATRAPTVPAPPLPTATPAAAANSDATLPLILLSVIVLLGGTLFVVRRR